MMNIERSKKHGERDGEKKENVVYYLAIPQMLLEKQTDKLRVYLVIGRQLYR